MFGGMKPLVTVLSIFSLSGCGTLWQMPIGNWASQNAASNYEASKSGGPSLPDNNQSLASDETTSLAKIDIAKTINRAIADLGRGDTATARHKLNAVLQADPANANAQDFLAQIDMDPKVYFGEEYFEYKVKRGDSMSRIADRFLKDHLKFYILTRYSGMNNPASLAFGQVVRIPMQYKPAKIANTQSPAKSPVRHEVKVAQSYLEQKRYLDAIETLEAMAEQSIEARTTRALEMAYAGEAQRLEQLGELKRANLLYGKAAKISTSGSEYDDRISMLSDQIKAHDLQRLASLYLKSGQFEIALEHIQGSLALVPYSDAAKSLYQQIKSNRVAQLHEEAMEYFRDDKFAQALTLWNQALAIEPTHLLSKSYQERCRVILDQQQDIALSITEE